MREATCRVQRGPANKRMNLTLRQGSLEEGKGMM